MLVMMNFYWIKLIVIGLAINLAIKLAIETCYRSHRSDFYRFNQASRQFILLMNCTLGSIIHLGPNTVMTI